MQHNRKRMWFFDLVFDRNMQHRENRKNLSSLQQQDCFGYKRFGSYCQMWNSRLYFHNVSRIIINHACPRGFLMEKLCWKHTLSPNNHSLDTKRIPEKKVVLRIKDDKEKLKQRMCRRAAGPEWWSKAAAVRFVQLCLCVVWVQAQPVGTPFRNREMVLGRTLSVV